MISPMNELITLGRDCKAVQIPSGDQVTIPQGLRSRSLNRWVRPIP